MILPALTLALMVAGVVPPAIHASPASPPASGTLLAPIEAGLPAPIDEGLIVAPVYLNADGPFLFLVDTGATHTLVSRRVAERVGLRPAPVSGKRERPRIRSLGGSMGATLAIAGTLRVDSASFRDVPVLLAELSALRALDPALDGVIAQDLLATRNHLIDHVGGRLRFDEDGAIRRELSGIPVPLAQSHNRPMLTGLTRPSGERLALRLVLDSAATHVILLNDVSRPIARRLAPLPQRRVLSTHGGDRVVPMVRLDTLTLPTALLGELAAAVTPMPADQGRLEDGLLPTSLFRALYFDVAAGTVILNPVRKARGTASDDAALTRK